MQGTIQCAIQSINQLLKGISERLSMLFSFNLKKTKQNKNVCVCLCSNSGVWVCVRASAVEPKLCQGLEDAGVSKQNKYMSWITNYRWLCGWSEERHRERGMYKVAMKQGLCSVGKNINFPTQQSTLNSPGIKMHVPFKVSGCVFMPIWASGPRVCICLRGQKSKDAKYQRHR